MNAFKRSLALLLVIAMMIPSFAFAEDILVMDQSIEALELEQVFEEAEVSGETEEEAEEVFTMTDLFAELPIEEEPAVEEVPAEEEESDEIHMDELAGELASNCAHENGNTNEGRETVYATDNGDGTHNVEYVDFTSFYCHNCYETLYTYGEPYTVDAEPHKWYGYKYNNTYEAYCESCYAMNTCEHDLVKEENYRYIQDANDNGDGTHTLSYYPDYKETCTKCAVVFYLGYDYDNLLTVTEPHNFEYGWCQDCYAEITCDHVNFEKYGENKWPDEVLSSDANGCSFTYARVEYGHCYDCDSYVEIVLEEGLTAMNEPHAWTWYRDEYDNLYYHCGVCGMENTCSHEWNVLYSDRNVLEASDNGDGTHDLVCTFYEEKECALCGCGMWQEYEEPQTLEGEPHEFEGLECRWCRAENPCEHKNAIENGWNEFDEATVHSYDANGHTITAYKGYYYYCPDCYSYYNVTESEPHIVNQYLPHEYNNGRCWICEYVNICTHPNFEFSYEGYDVDWEREDWLISTTATTHTYWAKEYREGRCPDCNEYIYETGNESVQHTEAHYYYDDDGKCGLCEYVPTCKHKNTVTSEGLRTSYNSGNLAKVNDDLHSVVRKIVKVVTCVDCGYETETTQSTYTALERHDFYMGDRCECGYVNTCKHKNTADDTWYNWAGVESVDSKTHKLTLQKISATCCVDCGATLTEKASGTETETAYHYFGAANICTDCGYVSTCKHSETTTSTDNWSRTEAISLEKHQKLSFTEKSVSCKKCKAYLYQRSSATLSVGKAAAHTFENGYCTACNMPEPAGACKHVWDNGVCTKCEETCVHSYANCVCVTCGLENHNVVDCVCTVCKRAAHSGISAGDCYCEGCGKTLHTFGEDGRCTNCNECNHKHPYGSSCNPCELCGYTTHEEENFAVETTYKTVYEDIDDPNKVGYHTETITGYSVTYCTICGKAVSEEPNGYVQVWESEHNFNDSNTCMYCGAAEPQCPDNYETGLHMGEETCDYCGVCMIHFNGGDDSALLDEVGTCTVCGYNVDGCQHVLYEDAAYYEFVDSTCEYLNSQQHVIKGTVRKTAKCKLCRKMITIEMLEGEVSQVEYHNGDDGDGFCSGCGTKFNCQHEVMYTSTYFERDYDKEIVYANEEGHGLYGWMVTVSDCEICYGCYETSGDEGESQLFEGEHNWIVYGKDAEGNRVVGCVDCNYESILPLCEEHDYVYTPWKSIKMCTVQDSKYHVVSGYDSYWKDCTVCVYEDVEYKFLDNEIEPHTFVNDICTGCGLKVVGAQSIAVKGLDENNAMIVGLKMTQQIVLDVQPAGAEFEAVYTSSDKKVATVDENGVITGVAGGKSATITVSPADAESTVAPVSFTVKVVAPSKVTLNAGKATLGVGETITLVPTAAPDNAPVSFTAKSSNGKVATVAETEEGFVVEGVKAGTAKITVSTQNGKTATCAVTVKAAPTGIKLDKEAIELANGEAAKLKATLSGKKAASAITWTSSNEAVATVEDGAITTVGAGETTITASTFNGYSASCTVKVWNAVASIEIENEKLLSVSQKFTPEIKLLDAEGNETIGAYTVSTGNKTYATISGATITAKKATKSPVAITVKAYNDVEAVCNVAVVAAPTKITATPTKATLGVGEKAEIKVAHTKAEAPTTYSFSVSKKGIVNIEAGEDGVYTVEAVKAGSATITFKTHNGKKATCKITVKAAPTGIKLDKSELDIVYKDTAKLKATLEGKSAGGAITWKSSNENAVTVDANGTVTAVRKGVATITATTYNGFEASCEVEVHWPAQSVYIKDYNVTLSVGQKYTPDVELWDAHFNETIGTYSLKTASKTYAAVSGTTITAKKVTKADQPVRIDVILDGEALDSIWVTVVAAPKAVTLAETKLTLSEGEAFQLEPNTNGTPASFTYSSSKKSVATVDSNGVVKAVAPGTAKITVKTQNGKKVTCTVTVVEAAHAPSVEMASFLGAEITPAWTRSV